MREDKILGCFSLAAFVAVSVIVSSITGGWALSIMWGWFIVPLFGLPPLTIPYAIGISLIVGFLAPRRTQESDGTISGAVAESLSNAIFIPLMFVAVGWIVSRFV